MRAGRRRLSLVPHEEEEVVGVCRERQQAVEARGGREGASGRHCAVQCDGDVHSNGAKEEDDDDADVEAPQSSPRARLPRPSAAGLSAMTSTDEEPAQSRPLRRAA